MDSFREWLEEQVEQITKSLNTDEELCPEDQHYLLGLQWQARCTLAKYDNVKETTRT